MWKTDLGGLQAGGRKVSCEVVAGVQAEGWRRREWIKVSGRGGQVSGRGGEVSGTGCLDLGIHGKG